MTSFAVESPPHVYPLPVCLRRLDGLAAMGHSAGFQQRSWPSPTAVPAYALLESRKGLPEDKKAIREGKISLSESKIAFPEQLFQIRESKKVIPMQQISAPEWLFCIPEEKKAILLIEISSTEYKKAIPEEKKALIELAAACKSTTCAGHVASEGQGIRSATPL